MEQPFARGEMMESGRSPDDEKERLLWNLRSLPDELVDLAGSLDDEALRWRPIPTKWSVKEILCHLRDFEREAVQFRYRTILAEDDPYLPRLDNEAKQAEGDYINQDGVELLREIRRLRIASIAILEQAPVSAWSRTGRHFSAGRITLEQIVARNVRHDMTHLGQIRDIVSLKLPSWRCGSGPSLDWKLYGKLSDTGRFKKERRPLRRQVLDSEIGIGASNRRSGRDSRIHATRFGGRRARPD